MLMLGFGGLTGCSSDSDTSNETDAADQSDATDTSDPSDASDATDTSNACANDGFDAVAALSTIQVAESYAKLEGYGRNFPLRHPRHRNVQLLIRRPLRSWKLRNRWH